MHASGGELGGEEPPGLGAGLPAGIGEVGHGVLQQPRQPRPLGRVSVARGAVHRFSVPPQSRVEGDASSRANTRTADTSASVRSPTCSPSIVMIPNARASVATGTAMKVR
jgi:hypothetical protein